MVEEPKLHTTFGLYWLIQLSSKLLLVRYLLGSMTFELALFQSISVLL
jgi:hypothetical protein